MPNPYPSVFLDQVEYVSPPDWRVPVILDLGSGGRSMPGVISMEYVPHPDNDLQGDCLALPFRDGCVDLILSQAVIEHVTDPQLAFNEMRRVLRPGGILYVEIAFMQPVHMAPYHYFNVTPYGLTYLLRDWDVQWQGTVGTPEDVINWISRTYRDPRKRGYGLRAVSPAHYELAASGVSALARKPV